MAFPKLPEHGTNAYAEITVTRCARNRPVEPRREAMAWRLYAQGHTAQEIAELAAPLWGYTTTRQCRRSLYEQFAAKGRPVRPAQRRSAVPELDRERALELLEAAG